MQPSISDRIRAAIARHRLFETGQRVGVAVSGGADSVFLLHALRELAASFNLHLSVVHIEHGIRGEASKADLVFVERLAAEFGLMVHLREASVPLLRDSARDNLEQAARRVRHGFFQELIVSGHVDCVATGHTRGDQAETVLYRILRGSGLSGLAGILPVTAEGLVRPLLEIDRSEIEAWLRERGIAWREDSTNRDLSYARNRIRHQTLPALRAAFNPRLDHALAHLATLARDEESHWAELVSRCFSTTGRTVVSPIVVLPIVVLPATELTGDRALARRLVRAAVAAVKGDVRQLGFHHVEAVIDLAGSPKGHAHIHLPGVEALRSFEWIRLAPAGFDRPCKRDFHSPVSAPGSVELPDNNGRISLQRLSREAPGEACVTLEEDLDWQKLTSGAPEGPCKRLDLRNWRPGDQYRRTGEARERKIKFLFQEFRIPVWERRCWPVLELAGEIIWARRFGPAQKFAAGPATRLVLRVRDSHQIPNQPDPR